MTVTAKLLRLFRVDQQLRGLRSRLDAAERFLAEQERQLKEIDTRHGTITTQLKKLKTTVAGEETEVQGIDERMASLRDKMNLTKTNKEYSALLTELNNLKTKKDELESGELEQMQEVENLQKQDTELLAQREERAKIAAQAKAERDNKAAEIKDRLAELKSQRDTLAADVPADAKHILDDLISRRGDDAMAHVEVLDRRSHEWSCGACMMALTVETINKLSTGSLTRCNNCMCILFTEEDVVSKKKPKDNEDVAKSRKRSGTKTPNDAAA
ncbi:MAG: zinc ribbon domain-containing protein [Phycisphaerales bacterium]